MNNARRAFLKLGAGAAFGPMVLNSARAASSPIVVPAQSGPGGDALRLATYSPATGQAQRVGAVMEERTIVDLADAAKEIGLKLSFDPSDMLALIAAGADGIVQARNCAFFGPTKSLDSVRLMAPIPVPARNIYAVGWNYLEHFGESLTAKKADLPTHPVFFTKGTHTINGPYEPIPFDPAVSTKIDWEGELAVIIGTRGRNIAESDAMSHVFGYTVINDTTARDMQIDHGGQWFKGKSLDGHGPTGPWIVVADTIDCNNLRITTRVNGVVKQDINTSKMYFKVPRLISDLSLGLTLEPGDIIATGTPSGIGAARTPPEFLKPNDVMETEIDRIGLLRNEIRQVGT
jgi:2-keto-4-pentenoate hydratase/2-oxohepta-3-ene-1,7-dioic acid hydratase in catechol pathway